MKINGEYSYLINRIAESAKEKTDSTAQRAERPGAERQELSRLAALLQQELSAAQAEHSTERAERVQRLAADLNRGSYRVDDEKLAAAMLDL